MSITSPQGSDAKLDEKRRRCLELANLHDGITTISFDLWSELGEVIRNLMIGNYSSISRSLRWVIETIAFWRDMEKDNENAKDRFSYYFNKESPMTKRRFSYLYKHILDTSIIEDRLKLKQKYLKKNDSFEDMVRNGHTSKSKSVNKVLDIIIENYKKLYGEFSSVSHVSLRSLIETEKENPEDYLFFLYYSYNKNKFLSKLATIWKIVDLMACTFILYRTDFYAYNTPGSYMVSLVAHQRTKSDAEKLISLVESQKVKKKLPFLFSLIGERKQQICIDARKFSPPRITVECGDIVMWINNNAKSHTVISGHGPKDPKLGKYFDSDKDKNKKLVGKKKIFLHTFRDPGKYDYFCRVHQEETGSIIVHK